MNFDWVAQELVALVRQQYPEWDGFDYPSFVDDEIDYKQAAASKARALLGRNAFAQLLEQEAWDEIFGRIETVAQATNLLFTRIPREGDLALLYSDQLDRAEMARRLYELLHTRTPIYDRLDDFFDYLLASNLPHRWPLPTYLLFLLQPHNEMFVKPSVAKWFLQFIGIGEKYSSSPTVETYTAIRKNAHALKGHLASYGPRDMIDIQSLIWVAAQVSKRRTETLSAEQQVSLDVPPTEPETVLMAREAEPTYATSTTAPTLSDVTQEIGYSEETVQSWLSVLDFKKQIVLVGPPGTGKTYMAQRLAHHLAGGSGMVELLQFHPAFSYEAFVQGIRPTADSRTGQLSYRLQKGHFVRFCEAATAVEGTCVLILDEINRAHLAQLFGELLVGLEYRDQPIALAEGGQLTVPSNVRIIGTMNSADRSLALVDLALRRRFGFIEIRPNLNHLTHFLQRCNLDPTSLVQTLEQINGELEPALQLGTSYFLRSDLADTLPLVWQTEIEPYLDEIFFDQPARAELYRWAKLSKTIDLNRKAA